MKDQEQQRKQAGSQFQRDFRLKGLPCGSAGKESACNAGELGSIPGLGRSPGEGHGNPLQYLVWRIPLDREAWRATHGVTKSWTRLSDD